MGIFTMSIKGISRDKGPAINISLSPITRQAYPVRLAQPRGRIKI